MKAYPYLLLTAALVVGGCQSAQRYTSRAAPGDVTVNFLEQDEFTDARDSFAGKASESYLNELGNYVKEVAAARLPAGQKLTVTFTDIDLAGDIVPGQTDEVRVVTGIYVPRMKLLFRLQDPDGAVIREGERTLLDLNFQQNISVIDRNDPLRYDKQLLRDWLGREFET